MRGARAQRVSRSRKSVDGKALSEGSQMGLHRGDGQAELVGDLLVGSRPCEFSAVPERPGQCDEDAALGRREFGRRVVIVEQERADNGNGSWQPEQQRGLADADLIGVCQAPTADDPLPVDECAVAGDPSSTTATRRQPRATLRVVRRRVDPKGSGSVPRRRARSRRSPSPVRVQRSAGRPRRRA